MANTHRAFLAAVAALALLPSFGWQKALILKALDAEGVRRVKDNGFDGVEIRLHDESAAEAAAARKFAAENGVVIHSVMANGWYAFDDETKFDAELAKAKRELEVAAAYGVDTILVVSGSRRSEEKRYLKLTAEEQAKVDAATRRAFAELVPIAARLKVVLALEFVWNNCWADPEAYAAFVKSFGSPWVKIYLDLGNGLKFAPTEKWISAAGGLIRRVHVKDFELDPSMPRGGEFVAFGTGDVDFAGAKRALEAVGYTGWVSVEEGAWSDAEYARLVDWFFAGAPSGEALGNWTIDIPSWKTVTADVKDGKVRIVRRSDGRSRFGDCPYDVIRGTAVGDELFCRALTFGRDGKPTRKETRFVGRRQPSADGSPSGLRPIRR